jgi:hypothetical protein
MQQWDAVSQTIAEFTSGIAISIVPNAARNDVRLLRLLPPPYG